MSDAATHAVPAADRGAWLRNLRRVNEQQEDALAGDFDPNWGEIEPTHQAFVERFLSRLPPAGRVLDAACGTGKYFPMVLASGRGLLGVDHAGAYLAVAATKFPQVPHRQVRPPGAPLPGRVRRGAVRGRHGVPPTRGLATGPGALPPRLRRGDWLYLTVELARGDRVRAANQAARRAGLPVVDGEVIWEEPEGYYHHYPSMEQVRAWLADAGFTLDEDAEGPWHEEGYAYHHVLARLASHG